MPRCTCRFPAGQRHDVGRKPNHTTSKGAVLAGRPDLLQLAIGLNGPRTSSDLPYFTGLKCGYFGSFVGQLAACGDHHIGAEQEDHSIDSSVPIWRSDKKAPVARACPVAENLNHPCEALLYDAAAGARLQGAVEGYALNGIDWHGVRCGCLRPTARNQFCSNWSRVRPPLKLVDVDEQYFAMLPTSVTEITAEEADELSRVFGRSGELRADRLS